MIVMESFVNAETEFQLETTFGERSFRSRIFMFFYFTLYTIDGIGITTQTILTIPMCQQPGSSEQLAQTIAASNNFTASQHQKQQKQQQQQQGAHQMSNILASASLLSPQTHQQKQQQGKPLNVHFRHFHSGS